MDFTNLLRSVDSQHDAYQGRIIELFDQYRGWVVESANGARDARIENDAEYARVLESLENTFNAAISGADDENDPVFDVVRKEFHREKDRALANHTLSAEAITRSAAARDARSYEWLCLQLQIAKHDFNIKLIDSIAEFAA